MKVSKFLASTAATAAIVGAIGFAYAQTSTDNPASSPSGTMSNTQAPADTSSSSMSNTPAASSSDLAARADRG
jgi:hypothetical protein